MPPHPSLPSSLTTQHALIYPSFSHQTTCSFQNAPCLLHNCLNLPGESLAVILQRPSLVILPAFPPGQKGALLPLCSHVALKENKSLSTQCLPSYTWPSWRQVLSLLLLCNSDSLPEMVDLWCLLSVGMLGYIRSTNIFPTCFLPPW